MANLIRGIGTPEVYLTEGQTKRHVISPKVFEAGGFDWGNIQEVPIADLEKYQTGSPYLGQEGSLIRLAGTPEVYYTSGGMRYHIPSPEAFEQAGLRWEDVMELEEHAGGAFGQIPIGEDYSPDLLRKLQQQAKMAAQIKAGQQQIQTGQEQLLSQVGAGREEFQAGQAASEADLLKRYTEALGGQESMEAMYQRLSGELNLPQLREERQALNRQVLELEQTLAGMPEQVMGETRGYDVSARQQARLEQARADPFREQLIQMGRRAGLVGEELTGAEAQLGTRMGLTQAQQEKMMLPYGMEQTLLSGRIARETTGYNMDRQAELDVLLNRIEAGEALSAEERQRAHELAMLEQQFQNEQKKLETEAGYRKEEAETGFGYDLKLLQEQSRLAEASAGPEQQRKIELLREQAKIAEEAAPNDQARQIELLREQSRLAGLDTQVITAGGSMLLVDMQTGIIVANLGAAASAGGGAGGVTLNLGGFEGFGGEPTEPKPPPPTNSNQTLEDIFGKRPIGASGSW